MIEKIRDNLVIVFVMGMIFLVTFIRYAFFPLGLYLDTPVPDSPVITGIMAIVAGLVIYSWWCGGSDHKQNVSPEHPDGRLTYPGDKNE